MNPTTSSPRPSSLPPLTLCELADPGLPGVESYSPFCLKIHRALRACGLPYQRYLSDDPREYTKVTPTGQVPILRVGSEVVPDSTDILRRIQSLAPRPLAESPEAWLWEELADTAVNGFLVAARWADARNWPLTRVAYFPTMPAVPRAFVPGLIRRKVLRNLVGRDVWRAGPEACWRRFGALLDQLDARAPAQGFWVGAELSVADVALFAQLHSLRTPLTVWQREQIAQRPGLSAWLDRVDAATRAPSAGAQVAA